MNSLRKRGLTSDTRGIALPIVIAAILVLSLLVAWGMRSSTLGQKVAGLMYRKATLDEVAQSALQLVQLRLNQRMNPAKTNPYGTSWTQDQLMYGPDITKPYVYNGYATPANIAAGASTDDPRCPASCWCDATNKCYHGYRFQHGANVATALDGYAADFIWEGDAGRRVGIFQPCTVANGCAKDKTKQWTAKYVGATNVADATVQISSPSRLPWPTPPVVDIMHDGIPDEARRLKIQVTAYDETNKRRTVIQTDLILTAQAADTSFTSYANVLSRMSLFSGYIQGKVAYFLDPDRLPTTNYSSKLQPFYFGELGEFHWSCKFMPNPPYSLRVPCSNIAGFQKDQEAKPFFTDMQIDGLATNLKIGTWWAPFSGQQAGTATSPQIGLLIDDGDSATGNSAGSPADALTDQPVDRASFFKNMTVPGRDSAGGIPGTQAYLEGLAKKLNAGVVSPNLTIPVGSTARVYQWLGGGQDAWEGGGPQTAIAPFNVSVPEVAKHSVVLDCQAPGTDCRIDVKGTVVINGDLILAGSTTAGSEGLTFGVLGSPKAMTLFATGNVYILNNIRTANEPPTTDPITTGPNNFRYVRFNAAQYETDPTHAKADRLSIIAGQHMIIGNLANSQNFAHAMTYANSELNYFKIDLTGEGNPDFLVPDGARPLATNSPPTRPLTTNSQVRRALCNTYPAGMIADCAPQAAGLLPEGAALVSSIYDFAFMEYFAGSTPGYTQAGYGYVRNPADAAMTWPLNRAGTKPSTALGYDSGLPVDLFGVNAWISTVQFQTFAGAPVDNTNPLTTHDSLDPNYINRAHVIMAKLYAGSTILGLASFDDKYQLPDNTANKINPDEPYVRPIGTTCPGSSCFAAYTTSSWGFSLFKDVNNLLTRHIQRCTTSPPPADIPYQGLSYGGRHPMGLDIFGGVYAPYINITSTNGLCIYQDNRGANLGHEEILTVVGSGYKEDVDGAASD
ncbi:MAG: hypothetical protein V1798_10750 [Pseudomonadota bacterium]